MRPEELEEAAECFNVLSSLYSGAARRRRSSPGSSSSSSSSEVEPSSPPSSGPTEDVVSLPWGAVELILGLGDRRFSRAGRDRLEALRADIVAVADETGLPPALLAGLAFVESEADPDREGPELGSGQRAQGLLQVLPSNLERMGVPRSRWHDPRTNLRAGARVLIEPPEPFGQVEPGRTLAAYGGFQTKDPTSYVQDVQTMSLRAARELGYSLWPGDEIRSPDL